MAGILADLRVIELSAFVAVPLAGLTLAQLGADVIRIDPIGGGVDAGRWPVTADGTSLYWAGLNKGKRSVAVDLRSDAGRRLVGRLAASAATVITNLPLPWLDYASLSAETPDLVMLRLRGDHEGGIAVDYTVNARVGYPLVTGDGHGPVKHVLPAWDVIAGNQAAMAVLAADRHRLLTGLGTHVSIALSDVAMATVAHLGHIAEVSINDADRPAHGNYLYGAYGKDFATADGRWVEVVAITSRQWSALVDVTGTREAMMAIEADLGVDLAAGEGVRFAPRERITAALEPWFAARSLAQIGRALEAANVLWAPYQTFRQLIEEDPHASTDNPMFQSVDHPGIGTHLTPTASVDFSATARMPAAPAPLLGADTDQVLSDVLGVSDVERDGWRADGVIG